MPKATPHPFLTQFGARIRQLRVERKLSQEAFADACGIDRSLSNGQPDPGLIIASDTSAGADDFVAAIATHRHFARETDPPRV